MPSLGTVAKNLARIRPPTLSLESLSKQRPKDLRKYSEDLSKVLIAEGRINNSKSKKCNVKHAIAYMCIRDFRGRTLRPAIKKELIRLFEDKTQRDKWVKRYVRNGNEHEQVITSKTGELILNDLKNTPKVMCALTLQERTNTPTRNVVFSNTTVGRDGKISQDVHPTSKRNRYIATGNKKSGAYGSTSAKYHIGSQNSLKYEINKIVKSTDPYRYRDLNERLFQINNDYLADRLEMLLIRPENRSNEKFRLTHHRRLRALNNKKDLHETARHVEIHRKKIAFQFLETERVFANSPKSKIRPVFKNAEKNSVDPNTDTKEAADLLTDTPTEFT